MAKAGRLRRSPRFAEEEPINAHLDVLPGVRLWPEQVDRGAQASLVAEILQLASIAPFYRPQMPGSGKDFSVEETNFGELGWVSDRSGYRYDNVHPVTGHVWPAMPPPLLGIWSALTDYPAAPQCCLVNLYRDGARMGLHQDRDEAVFVMRRPPRSTLFPSTSRFGGNSRRGPTKSIRLRSGDIVVFGGPARLAFHGIDRIIAGTSQLIPGGGRINLTLRRVTAA